MVIPIRYRELASAGVVLVCSEERWVWRTMKTARGNVTVIPLNDSTGRMAIQVDGVITFVGSPEECQRRLKVLYRSEPDRSARDQALGRAIQYA